MASYLEFSETVSRDEILPAYKQLLTDLNYCINLFEDLESGRTLWETITDWTVGERNSINIIRTKERLNTLKLEIEKGIECYIHLCIKMKGAEIVEQSYLQRIDGKQQSCYDDSLLVRFKNDFNMTMKSEYNRLTQAVTNINEIVLKKEDVKCETGIVSGAVEVVKPAIGVLEVVGPAFGIFELAAVSGIVVVGASGVAVATVAVAAVAAVAILSTLIGSIAYAYARSQGKDRGMKYKEVKQLSDALNNNEILSLFQSHHACINGISLGLDKTIDMCKEQFESMIKSSNTLQDSSKSAQIYEEAFQENLRLLQESEPEMSEATRKRMATKLAETACRTFLMEVLNYSETEANEFIRTLKQ